jgi:3-dehydroquinate synthase
MIFSSNNSAIYIGESVNENLLEFLDTYRKSFRVFVLLDANTDKFCFPLLSSVLHDRYDLNKIVIEPGESSKTIEVCNFIWNQLLILGAEKQDILICLGGGVVTDIGGFAASVYKRGIDFVHIPTSLMGMTDAALGGKNGVDFNDIKNSLGLISFPNATIIDTFFLKTLNDRELKNGWAEIFKHALIADINLWDLLPEKFESAIPISEIIERSIKIKLDVISQDPYENGLRKILNFGHSIGHAIESSLLKDITVLHGEAVVAGMVIETMLSVRYNLLEANLAESVINKLISFFGKIELSNDHLVSVMNFIAHDKKNANGKFNFVLLKNIGQPAWDISIDSNDIIDAYEAYINL